MGITGLDPIANGQVTAPEIKRCEADPDAHLQLIVSDFHLNRDKQKGARYTPVSKRQDRPDALAWILKHHPDLSDARNLQADRHHQADHTYNGWQLWDNQTGRIGSGAARPTNYANASSMPIPYSSPWIENSSFGNINTNNPVAFFGNGGGAQSAYWVTSATQQYQGNNQIGYVTAPGSWASSRAPRFGRSIRACPTPARASSRTQAQEDDNRAKPRMACSRPEQPTEKQRNSENAPNKVASRRRKCKPATDWQPHRMSSSRA